MGDAEADRGQISNYMEQYSFKELRDKQLRDPDLQPLFGWLEHAPDHLPREGELRMQSPATHNLWKHRTQLRWHHGVLQYQWDYGAWQSWLLVVPSQLKEEMMVQFHDAPTGGHLGVNYGRGVSGVVCRGTYKCMSPLVQSVTRTRG